MAEGKRIRDIMIPIEEYETVGAEDRLCDALAKLKRTYENAKACAPGNFHKTLFVVDDAKQFIGKISMYDLIRGLVPAVSKDIDASPREEYVRSARIWEIEQKTAELSEQMGWLTRTFVDLVGQEAKKKVKEIMSPVHPILKEEDSINQAIYLTFRVNERQPLVIRDGVVVGVVDLMRVFEELLDVAGPECGVHWKS